MVIDPCGNIQGAKFLSRSGAEMEAFQPNQYEEMVCGILGHVVFFTSTKGIVAIGKKQTFLWKSLVIY